MTAARGERPERGEGGRVRVIPVGCAFDGRLGTIVEARVKGRGLRLRVRLDNDEGYSWWFAKGDLEVVE